MKKILFSLVALLAVMTVQAQSIYSSWHILQPVVETNADGSFTAHSYTYTFYEDGTYYMVDEVTLATEPSQTMALEVATAVDDSINLSESKNASHSVVSNSLRPHGL